MPRGKKKAAEGAETPDYSAHFEANPGVNTLLVTSDGQVFTEANAQWAKSHAKGLEDRTITEVHNDDAEGEEEDAE
ncbi:hypothetical protein GCM10023185_06870 [Hymenobacter saemangeumensis]|uniref:Uncharacterized protein n=1 Tax=Hymenobacter saemangeumensis TaxID=1084522 RepID=A0ABP8I236_9BACT